MDENLARFIEYVKIDTQADDQSMTIPSQAKELNLTRKLQQDLKELGIETEINEFGILYGKVDGEPGLDPIGFNAHVDTALECSDKDVKPRVIEKYDGGVIHLNDQYSMSPKKFPSLGLHIGDDLVVTSGDTLLGADDKAGVAAIMSLLAYVVKHPEFKHHPICFCFTVDEEIGRGPDHFDAKRFGAKYAYTIDGAKWDEIAIENFNAAHANVIIHGISIHPGEAKGKMVNAARLAGEFDALLPADARPELTEGREGFNHLVAVEGGCDEAKMHYIIRNHDRALLEKQKQDFANAKAALEKKYPAIKVDVIIGDDYRNMKEVIDEHPEAVEKVLKAFHALGVEPTFNPIRGGTDGATFTFKGCPTPNLGTGSFNHHGRFEYLSVQEWNKVIELMKEIIKA